MPNTPDNNNTGSTQNSRIVRVRDLPIYYDAKTDDIYRYVPRINNEQPKTNNSKNNWLYPHISQLRQSIQQTWNDNKELRQRVARGIETGEAHSKATIDYIRDDQTFLPKVGVVTIAGLGGLLLGHRGGAIRKTFYATVAAGVALSACYPKQSANLLDQLSIRIKNESQNLFNKTTNQSAILESKDRILHTVKKTNEPTMSAKGDYGQGTPADQHLYTTRGVIPVNSEKKA